VRRARRGLAAALAVLAAAGAVAACGGDSEPAGQTAAPAGRTATTPHLTAPEGTGAQAITVVGRRRIDDRLQELTLRTPALDAPTHVRVLLPRGYDADPSRRYPVLYLLHGANSDYTSWTEDGGAEALTARYPLIVVMPDGGSQGWYTDWYRGDATVQPRWETYHVNELVPWVDARFRTDASRAGRAIAGLSMGGYGALDYAARHPDVYAAAASFSGALEIGSEEALGTRSSERERWREHLPVRLAARLRSLALVEIRTGDGKPGPLDPRGTQADCGACELERFLHPSNVRMHERLQRLGIRHVWDDYGPGTHSWPYWRRDLRETLPGLMRALRSP
jgi:S-formylglutathione hydrolase FrmB